MNSFESTIENANRALYGTARRRTVFFKALTGILAFQMLFFGMAPVALALPQTSGTLPAGVTVSGNTMTIASGSDFTWDQGFNIGSADTVDITAGNTIHRDTSGNLSNIQGTLNAHGSDLWILNPAGILFGAGASVNVGGHVAAAMNGFGWGTSYAPGNVGGNVTLNNKGGSAYTVAIGQTVSGAASGATVIGAAGMDPGSGFSIASGGGTITFTGTTGVGTKLQAGKVEMNGSTVGGGDVTATGADGITGNFSQSGGTITANGTAGIAGTLTQSGGSATASKIAALNQSGGTANTAEITGTANQSAGTINAGAAALTLGSGSSLGGTVTAGSVSVGNTGTLTLKNNAGLSDTQVTAGTLAFDAGTAGIELNNLSVGTIQGTAGNVTVNNTGALNLGTLSASSLDVTAGGAVSQTGAANVSGATSVTVADGSAVTLDNSGNKFSSVGVVGKTATTGAAGAVTINDSDSTLALDAIRASQLDVTAADAVTQTGAANVSGAATVTATGNNITLTQAGNQFGSIGATGANISITEANATALNAVAATGTLTVNAGGAVTQNAAADVTGKTTVTATGYNVTLANANNDLGEIEITGANVSVTDSTGDIDLKDVSANESITAIASQGTVKTTGTSPVETGSLTMTAGSGDINIETKVSTVEATATQGSVTITDKSAQAADTVLTVNGATASGDVMIKSDNNGVVVNQAVAAGTGNGGTLDIKGAEINASVTAGAGLTAKIEGQSPDIILGFGIGSEADTINFSANRDIVIKRNATVAGKTVSLKADSDGAIAAGDIHAGGVYVAGTVTAAEGDATITGKELHWADAPAAAQQKGVYFDGATVTSAGNVTIVDKSGDAEIATGGATIHANGGSIKWGADGATDIAKNVNSSGTLVLSQSDALTLANTITAGANALTLESTGGAVTMDGVTSGSLAVNAAGNVTQTAAATIAGATTVDAAGQNVTLDNAANTFGTIGVTGANVIIKEADGVALAATAASGTLDVTAGGDITQVGAVSATGDTMLDAGANAITLNNNGNDFGGNVTVNNTPASVNIHDASALTVSAITTSGAAELVAGGALDTQAVTANGGNATLQGASVAANGAVSAANGTVALIATAGDTTVGGNVTAGGNAVIIADGGTATIDNGVTVQAANLGVQGAAIANNGTYAGITQLAIVQTDPNQAVTLDDASIPAGAQTVGIQTAGDLTVNSDHALTFGNASVAAGGRTVAANGLASTAGAVDVAAAGDITSSAITGAGGTTVTAQGQQVNVTGNLGGGGATVVTAGGLQSGALAGGSATLNIGGAANVGNLAVGGDMNGAVGGQFTTAGGNTGSIGQGGGFTAGGTTIDGALASGAVTITQGGAVVLNGALNGGNVNIAGASITGGGVLTAGALTLNMGGNVGTGPNNQLTVASANLQNITGGNIYLVDTSAGPVAINLINGTGDVDLQFAGDVNGGGTINAGNDLTLRTRYRFGDKEGRNGGPVQVSYGGTLTVTAPDGQSVIPLLHIVVSGDLPDNWTESIIYNPALPGFMIWHNQDIGYQIVGTSAENRRLLNRALAFSVNTPELKSAQGIFGNPAFLHTKMNVSEARPGANKDMLALQSVGLEETWMKIIDADLSDWNPTVDTTDVPLQPKMEALASEVMLQPEVQPARKQQKASDAGQPGQSQE